MDDARFRRAVRRRVLLSAWWAAAFAAAGATGGATREAAVSLELARQLFEDGCPSAAARECRRVLSAQPDDPEAVALLRTIEASRDSKNAGPPSTAGRITAAMVGIYRRGIGPAIGARCSLTPSCSEYFRQAGRRHGWLAFPMLADRLVREPGVVAAAEVRVADRIADPLEDHDAWLARRRR